MKMGIPIGKKKKRHKKNFEYMALALFHDESCRHARMKRDDLTKAIRKEGLRGFTKNLAGSGDIFVGEKALQAVSEMTASALSKSEWHGRIEVHHAAKKVVETYWKKMQPGFTLDNDSAREIVQEAISLASGSCMALTHFVPLHLIYEKVPDRFFLGSILFRRMEGFLAEIEPRFEEMIVRDAESLTKLRMEYRAEPDIDRAREGALEHSRDEVSRLKSYFQQFGWVASVDVPPSAPKISREQAIRAIEAALHFLRVLLGARNSDLLRLDADPLSPSAGAELRMSETGKLGVITSTSWNRGNSLGEDWWDIFNSPERRPYADLAGRICNMLPKFNKLPPIAQRLLDAATWYGEAVSDRAAGTRLVKYVAALERLTIFGEHGTVTALVKNRGALLCCDGPHDIKSWGKKIDRVYNARSRQVHGGRSPYDPGLNKMAAEASEIARMGILQFMLMTIHSDLESPSITEAGFREGFERMKVIKDISQTK